MTQGPREPSAWALPCPIPAWQHSKAIELAWIANQLGTHLAQTDKYRMK